MDGQDSVMNSVTEAYTEYDLAVNGGARGEVLREVTEVAKAFTLCHAKIRYEGCCSDQSNGKHFALIYVCGEQHELLLV